MERKIKLFIGFIVLLVFVQCDSPHFYQEQFSVRNDWNKGEAARFEFEIKDTVSQYNMLLLSRNNNKYPYNNLFLFTKMKDPSGREYIDTLQYYLAKKDGEWIGTGNQLKELYLLYRQNLNLKDTGVYELTVKHGMREENLQGIEDISLIIDKTDE